MQIVDSPVLVGPEGRDRATFCIWVALMGTGICSCVLEGCSLEQTLTMRRGLPAPAPVALILRDPPSVGFSTNFDGRGTSGFLTITGESLCTAGTLRTEGLGSEVRPAGGDRRRDGEACWDREKMVAGDTDRNPAGVDGVGVWETESTPESKLSLFWKSAVELALP